MIYNPINNKDKNSFNNSNHTLNTSNQPDSKQVEMLKNRIENQIYQKTGNFEIELKIIRIN